MSHHNYDPSFLSLFHTVDDVAAQFAMQKKYEPHGPSVSIS